MPLQTHFEEELSKRKAEIKTAFEKALKSGNLTKFAQKIGFIGERVIQQAFKTKGWGKWRPNAPLTQALKGSNSPLIDTAQMRKSITSRVSKKSNKAIADITVKL
ncbi:MAG: hypothetical protein LBQ47_02805 [Endomicrobium sp.]|jgi:hypothetical protein|nr:hypothetical protein [Endomicrobium sp.]